MSGCSGVKGFRGKQPSLHLNSIDSEKLTIKVSWALLGFIWGAFNLWSPVSLALEPEAKQWTFGQVMAIALLIVPFVSLLEGFHSRKHIHYKLRDKMSNDLF